ncbi:MAG TPA: hypothetical protein VMU61_07605 [Candidatus Aquilonibacter sp.]|nr:hypothetical protein [Candidatus Aquilonibacter sp.]
MAKKKLKTMSQFPPSICYSGFKRVRKKKFSAERRAIAARLSYFAKTVPGNGIRILGRQLGHEENEVKKQKNGGKEAGKEAGEQGEIEKAEGHGASAGEHQQPGAEFVGRNCDEGD